MSFVFPMMPSPIRELPDTPTDFWVQPKYDGLGVVVNGGQVYTHQGHDITDWCEHWDFNLNPEYPLVGDLVAVLDGTVLQGQEAIQKGNFNARVMAFDLMMEEVPLEERLKRLHLFEDDGLKVVKPREKTSWDEVNKMLSYAQMAGHSGLVLKKKNSFYYPSGVASLISLEWKYFQESFVKVHRGDTFNAFKPS